jgi:hypothetical protein
LIGDDETGECRRAIFLGIAIRHENYSLFLLRPDKLRAVVCIPMLGQHDSESPFQTKRSCHCRVMDSGSFHYWVVPVALATVFFQ